MRKLCPCLGLLAGLLLLAPAVPGQDQQPKKKKDDSHSRTATPEDYAALGHMKEVVGRLLSLDATADAKQGLGQLLTLKVDYPTLEPKSAQALQKYMQNRLRQEQQAQREYQNILRIRNPARQQQRLEQLLARLEQQANTARDPRQSPLKTVTNSVTFELPVRADVKIARAYVAVEYDDKGEVKQYTAEELKKKRDPHMPGYTAQLDDLQPGQMVKVYLSRPKSADKKNPKAKDQGKPEAGAKEKAGGAGDQGPAAAEPPPEESRPEVRMVLILSEPDPSALPAETPGKRKNKQQ
jgi:hypothetical protein